MAGLGIFLKNKHFAIPTIISGFLAVGLLGFDLAKTIQAISDLYGAFGVSPASASTTTTTATAGITVGFGLYIALAAALAIFIGSLITFFFAPSSTNRP
jgi:hypothetical protein